MIFSRPLYFEAYSLIKGYWVLWVDRQSASVGGVAFARMPCSGLERAQRVLGLGGLGFRGLGVWGFGDWG